MTLLAADERTRPDAAHVVVPPLRTRVCFWVLNRRVHPAYRPWAAAQLARPDYFRRQKLSLLAFWPPHCSVRWRRNRPDRQLLAVGRWLRCNAGGNRSSPVGTAA